MFELRGGGERREQETVFLGYSPTSGLVGCQVGEEKPPLPLFDGLAVVP